MSWDIPNVIINLRKEIEKATGDIPGLDSRVTTLENTVEPLPGRLTAVESEVDALQTDLDATPVTATGTSITIDNAAAIPAEFLSMEVKPVQDLNGHSKPWAGGVGKNKLPLVIADIKAANTEGTWSDNVYTFRGIVYTLLTDNAGNITGVNVNGDNTGTSSSDLWIPVNQTIDGVLNGCPTGGSSNTYLQTVWSDQYAHVESDTGSGVSVEGIAISNVSIRLRSGVAISNKVFYPMIRLATEIDPTFEPYTNICPITGKSSVKVETTDVTTTKDAEVTLGTTVYGGVIDFNGGSGSVTMANISSYDGESINEPWLSSLDEYTEGGTPTTGAQVVYPLDEPTTISFTADKLTLLEGEQTVTGNGGGDITISYQKDNLIGDLKKWVLANT